MEFAVGAVLALIFFHGSLVSNPGMPAWWPGFCGAYDVVAAGYLASLLLRRKEKAPA